MIRTAALACLPALVLAACTEVYTTTLGGGLAFNRSYLTPPAAGTRQVSPALPPGTAFGHDGLYAGRGQALNSQGARCAEFIRAGGFEVRGRHVSYGPFRGKIGREGELTMVYGRDTLQGQFVNDSFRGVLDFQTPPCSYAILLHRQRPP